MASDLLIRGGRPHGLAPADILVREGKVVAMGPGLQAPPGVPVEDVHGALVLPSLVEAHTHLDKTLWGMPWHANTAGPSLMDKIDHERHARRAWDIEPQRQSARQVALSVAQGSLHILSHVDIDTDQGLWCLEGVLATRERCRELVDIQLVAFPQSGLMRRPGTLALMDQALAMGCEWVGGLDPYAIDRDPKGQLDAIFALSQKHGRPIDIHLHEPDEMGALTLDLVFERVRALGLQGQVTISHAFCLGSPRSELVEPLIAELAALDIAVMTTGPVGWSAPPLKRLLAAGVRVSSGSDGVRDTWKHYGNADMLERATFLGLRNRLTTDADMALALEVCTHGGAQVMRLHGHGLAVGKDADLFTVRADNIAHAVAAHPPRELVVRRGAVVARNGQCLHLATPSPGPIVFTKEPA